MKRTFLILPALIAVVFFAVITQSHAAEYKGRIVDADTGEPIEGAVLNMEWTQRCPFRHGKFFDARETLTDKDGFFVIKGPAMNFNPICRTNEEPYFIAYKAGYVPIRDQIWFESSLKRLGFLQGENVEIKLRKAMSIEEMIRAANQAHGTFPSRFQRLLTKEINKECRRLKIDVYPEVDGSCPEQFAI